jgi:hypothetical protein
LVEHSSGERNTRLLSGKVMSAGDGRVFGAFLAIAGPLGGVLRGAPPEGAGKGPAWAWGPKVGVLRHSLRRLDPVGNGPTPPPWFEG